MNSFKTILMNLFVILIWFDLESLKNFVSEIETTVKNVDGSVVPVRLGVRIYYAAYPDKSSFGKFDDFKIHQSEQRVTFTLKNLLDLNTYFCLF